MSKKYILLHIPTGTKWFSHSKDTPKEYLEYWLIRSGFEYIHMIGNNVFEAVEHDWDIQNSIRTCVNEFEILEIDE